jgi:hypothetical protein
MMRTLAVVAAGPMRDVIAPRSLAHDATFVPIALEEPNSLQVALDADA